MKNVPAEFLSQLKKFPACVFRLFSSCNRIVMDFNANRSVASELPPGIKDDVGNQAPVISETQLIDLSCHPGLAFLRMPDTIPCFSPISFKMRLLVM